MPLESHFISDVSMTSTDPADPDITEDQFTCFDCYGEASVNQLRLSPTGFFRSKEVELATSDTFVELSNDRCQIELFGRKWDSGSILHRHRNDLFSFAKKDLTLMETAARTGVNILCTSRATHGTLNYFKLRKQLLEFFFFVRRFVNGLLVDHCYDWLLAEVLPDLTSTLNRFRLKLGRLTEIPFHIQTGGNKSNTASYHLFHVNLELRWLHLTLLLSLDKARHRISAENHDFSRRAVSALIESYVSELMELCLNRFEKIQSHDLPRRSPFCCVCVQELWILISSLTDALSLGDKSFRDYYVPYLEKLSSSAESSCTNLSTGSRLTFTLWMMYNVAKLNKLQGKLVQPEYNLLESFSRAVKEEELKEAELRTCLIFFEYLSIDLWEPRVEPIVVLWEYFLKKFNNHFYIAGAPPDSLTTSIKSSTGLISQIKAFLTENTVTDSFQHFLRIVGLHLKKAKDSPRHWNVIRGRIYSKLSSAKLSTLTEVGEVHLISLFITLALSVGINQVENKYIEIVKSIRDGKGLTLNLLKGQAAMIILSLNEGNNVSNSIKPLVEYISDLPKTENYDIIRCFVQEIPSIVSTTSSLVLGQHLLIDVWIPKYLSCSSPNDSTRLLDSLVAITDSLKLHVDLNTTQQEVIIFTEKLWDQLHTYLGSISNQTSPPQQAPDLACALIVLFLKFGNHQRAKKIVDLVIGNEVGDVRLLRRFVVNLMQDEDCARLLPNFNRIVIKTWFRCSFLCTDVNNSEMKQLTGFMASLPEISEMGNAPLIVSEDPICVFFLKLHDKWSLSQDIFVKQALREKLFSYLEGIDKWLKPVISSPKEFHQVNRLYITVGAMVRLNSPLIYAKSKPNTILQQVLDLMLLPNSVRHPEANFHANITLSISSSLHLFIEGLSLLNPEADNYVMRTFKELLIVYVPRCPAENFGLVTHFNAFDCRTKCLILDTLCTQFLKRKSRTPHVHSSHALKLIKELLQCHSSNHHVLKCVIKSAFARICDVVMFCDDKSWIWTLSKAVVCCILSDECLKGNEELINDVIKSLKDLSNEHLAWSSRPLFDLLVILSSVAGNLVEKFVPFLLEEIVTVEKKRGVGYDRTLRFGLDRIETNLRSIKQNST